MSDYLDQIANAKADVARLKGEKEAFEQSNEPDDADEEELIMELAELRTQIKDLEGVRRIKTAKALAEN